MSSPGIYSIGGSTVQGSGVYKLGAPVLRRFMIPKTRTPWSLVWGYLQPECPCLLLFPWGFFSSGRCRVSDSSLGPKMPLHYQHPTLALTCVPPGGQLIITPRRIAGSNSHLEDSCSPLLGSEEQQMRANLPSCRQKQGRSPCADTALPMSSGCARLSQTNLSRLWYHVGARRWTGILRRPSPYPN